MKRNNLHTSFNHINISRPRFKKNNVDRRRMKSAQYGRLRWAFIISVRPRVCNAWVHISCVQQPGVCLIYGSLVLPQLALNFHLCFTCCAAPRVYKILTTISIFFFLWWLMFLPHLNCLLRVIFLPKEVQKTILELNMITVNGKSIDKK